MQFQSLCAGTSQLQVYRFPAPTSPYKAQQAEGRGGKKALLLSNCPPFLFLFPSLLTIMHLRSLSSLLQDWELNDVSSVQTTWEGGGGGKGKGKGVEHRQADASMSIPWALWFGGWIRGRVLLFCNRKAHFQKFQHTAKNLSVWSWNNVQLYPFENTETEMILVAKGLQSASLAGKPGPWEAGSTAGDTVGVSQCAAPQFIRSISNKLQVWVVNSKLILHRQFSYCSLLLGLCLWSHLDGLANLSPRVLKWQIFCLVFLSFHMWSLWSY